ncbi:peptidase M10 [Pinibacter aurantiacus]|uniref:Peptidase M10 n=1 Tax=Pinibacter aurantiacus TaxID=2851599 RepID=A0A9E2SG69_9BACT|nr:peptidase M10 [Pinibacter aurantiacus]MBV4359890.1 peptidase M10 [Pinibacter aurantiacus]
MGEAYLDHHSQLLVIHSRLFFYGDAATESLAIQAAQDIQQQWNEFNKTVIIKRNTFSFTLRIEGFYKPDLTPEEVWYNDDPRNNYFRIEEFSSQDISFVDGIGCNTGYFKLANILDHSTTAAHEYGHTLGLLHPVQLDIRGKGAPGIMYPRGTICDPMYQYSAVAAPATPGGTLNPIHRKVLQSDVDNLQLHKLSFKNDRAVVGEFSSVYHASHGGSIKN